MESSRYQILYDSEFISRLPSFQRFWNPAVVAVCKWPNERSKYLKEQIEKWFQELPEKEKPRSYRGLRSQENHEHLSAFWELLIHQYAKEEGWDVEMNPVVEGKTPDFYIDTKIGVDFYLEVTSIGPSVEERKKANQQLEVLRAIDSIDTDYALSVGFREECETKVDLRGLRKEVIDWLSTLQKDKAQYKLRTDAHGVHMKITRSKFEKKPGSSCIGSYGGPGGFIGSEPAERMKKRMAEKNLKYGFVKEKKKPFVIAISTDEILWGDTQIEWALYGKDVISFPINDPDAQVTLHKDHSGFVTPNPGLKATLLMNTRLSAVILCQKRWNNDQMMYDMRVLHNPWAVVPIPVEIFTKMPQYVPVQDSPERLHLEWRGEGQLIYFH